MFTTDTVAKRLEVLRELVPKTSLVGLLVNPNGSKFTNLQMADEIRLSGLKSQVFEVSAESDLKNVFASAVRQNVDVLLVSTDPFFTTRRTKLVSLAAMYALPAAYPFRDYVDVGGLISYGPDDAEVYRELGVYAGRILKGAKASELPVQLPKKFDLVINLSTAKALGLTVPRQLFARADKMID
jgi:putative ABC transport system substrate-binding protein